MPLTVEKIFAYLASWFAKLTTFELHTMCYACLRHATVYSNKHCMQSHLYGGFATQKYADYFAQGRIMMSG